MEGQISLNDIFVKIKSFCLILKKYWLFIFIAGIIGAGLGYSIAASSSTTYETNTSFGVEGKGGQGMQNTAMAIAAQLGFQLGGSGVFPDNKMLIGLSKSRNAIKSCLLLPDTIDNKATTLANFYISNFIKTKNNDPQFLIKAQTLNQLTPSEDSLLDEIYANLIANNISVNEDEDVGLIRMKINSKNYYFTKHFAEKLMTFLNNFFLNLLNKEEEANFLLTQQKADSIKIALREKEERLARVNDSHVSTIKSEAKVEQVRLNRDIFILSKMYAEVTANVELVKYSMLKDRNIIIVIDSPDYSMKIKKKSKFVFTAVYAIVGLFIALLSLLVVQHLKNNKIN